MTTAEIFEIRPAARPDSVLSHTDPAASAELARLFRLDRLPVRGRLACHWHLDQEGRLAAFWEPDLAPASQL